MPYQHPCLLRGCNSDLAQYSITPRGRIRGQPVRRSFSLNAQGRPRKRGALHGRDVSEGGRTTTRTRTKRLVSTFNPLRGCNSGKALLIGLTRLFCKQQRSSTSPSTHTNAERRTPNAKRLVSAETRARGSARLYDPHVDPAPDFMDWYCKLREGKLFFHE